MSVFQLLRVGGSTEPIDDAHQPQTQGMAGNGNLVHYQRTLVQMGWTLLRLVTQDDVLLRCMGLCSRWTPLSAMCRQGSTSCSRLQVTKRGQSLSAHAQQLLELPYQGNWGKGDIYARKKQSDMELMDVKHMS
jgi:hypothetical protein